MHFIINTAPVDRLNRISYCSAVATILATKFMLWCLFSRFAFTSISMSSLWHWSRSSLHIECLLYARAHCPISWSRWSRSQTSVWTRLACTSQEASHHTIHGGRNHGGLLPSCTIWTRRRLQQPAKVPQIFLSTKGVPSCTSGSDLEIVGSRSRGPAMDGGPILGNQDCRRSIAFRSRTTETTLSSVGEPWSRPWLVR